MDSIKNQPRPPSEISFPDEMVALPQWVTHVRKEPYDPKTGKLAKANDPTTWADFTTAAYALRTGKYDGLGFEFSETDPFVGIDLDHCVDADGAIAEWAEPALGALLPFAYGEYSLSGTGIHLILKGTLPGGRGRKNKEFEIYDRGRYFTMTGKPLEGAAGTPLECQGLIDKFLELYFPGKKAAGASPRAKLDGGGVIHHGVTDDMILAKARAARNGAKFARLWDGVIDGYPSHSEADAALVGHLAFFCGPDPERIDRLFRQSGLYRDKWDKKDSGGIHGDRTIANILKGCTEFYKWSTNGVVKPKPAAPAAAAERQTVLPGVYSDYDLGNAERFVAHHGVELRYCVEYQRWLINHGTHWRRDNTLEVMRRAKEVVKAIALEAEGVEDPEKKKEILKQAKSSQRKNAIQNMVDLSRDALPIEAEALDTNIWLLNTPTGTLDLKADKVLPHRKDDYITKITRAKFVPSARAPRWQKFLQETTGNNPRMILFLQKLAGYLLTGSVREEKFFMIHGPGQSGKSKFLEALLYAFGDYAKVCPSDILLTTRGTTASLAISELQGVRLAWVDESDADECLAESRIKRLTGGDKLSARRLYESYFEFLATHKIVFTTNHKPTVFGQDTAIWRRICLIPFSHPVPDEKCDLDLMEKLAAEADGILAWAVQGCAAYMADGRLILPPEVIAETRMYQAEQDPLGDFISDCCEVSPTAEIPTAVMYSRYQELCIANLVGAIGPKTFTNYLRGRGFVASNVGGHRGWKGIKVKK